MTKRDKRLIVVIVVTILGMIGLLGYGMYIKHNQTKLIQSYERQAENKIDDVSAELEKAENYNKVIQQFLTGGGTSSSVNSLQTYKEIFAENDGMIGVLTVPKSDIRLPIYHGTEEETLNKGVGHVSDTAFPMDTIGTKSVLTGHNGMPGAFKVSCTLSSSD